MVISTLIPLASAEADKSTMMSKHGAVIFSNKKNILSHGHNDPRSRTLRTCRSSEHAEVAAIRMACNVRGGGKQECLQGKVAVGCQGC